MKWTLREILAEFYRDLAWVNDEYQRGDTIDFEGATLTNATFDGAGDPVDAAASDGTVTEADLAQLRSGTNLSWTVNSDGDVTLDAAGGGGGGGPLSDGRHSGHIHGYETTRGSISSTTEGIMRQFGVQGGVAAAVTEGDYIITADVSDAASSPAQIATADLSADSWDVTSTESGRGIDGKLVNGTLLFRDGGDLLVSVSLDDINNPVTANTLQLQTGGYTAWSDDTTMWDFAGGTLKEIDVSNPRSPSVVNTYETGLTNEDGISVGNRILTVWSGDTTHYRVVDLDADPTNVVASGSPATLGLMYGKGNEEGIFAGIYYDSCVVIDARDTSNITTTTLTFPKNYWERIHHVPSSRQFVLVQAGDQNPNHLKVIDATDPTAPYEAHTQSLASNVQNDVMIVPKRGTSGAVGYIIEKYYLYQFI